MIATCFWFHITAHYGVKVHSNSSWRDNLGKLSMLLEAACANHVPIADLVRVHCLYSLCWSGEVKVPVIGVLSPRSLLIRIFLEHLSATGIDKAVYMVEEIHKWLPIPEVLTL